jgi:hypothetical protein
MVFNATFNNILVISWRSVLLVEETGVPGENHWPVASHCQTLSHNVLSSTPCLSENRTHNISGDRHWLHRLCNKHLIYTFWTKINLPQSYETFTNFDCCLDYLVYLLPNTFKLFCTPIVWLWVYFMKVITNLSKGIVSTKLDIYDFFNLANQMCITVFNPFSGTRPHTVGRSKYQPLKWRKNINFFQSSGVIGV